MLLSAKYQKVRSLHRQLRKAIKEIFRPEISQRKIRAFIKSTQFAGQPQFQPSGNPSIAIVVPCYGHASFLREMFESIQQQTSIPLDCHLMVNRPEEWIEPFARAGADLITVHAEATVHLDRLIHRIHEAGCRAGVSINPGTSLGAIEEVLDLVDLVLIMSVNPGFGGQKFIPSTLDKVRRLASIRKDRSFLIEIDGGVSLQNARQVRDAGVDVLVAGTAVFGAADRSRAIRELRSNADGAVSPRARSSRKK
jgi:ribulose-phosphate 3-epimerase